MTWSDAPLDDPAGGRVSLDGELRWRSEYAIRVDEPAGGFVVTDDDQRAAIFVPLIAGGYRSQSRAWSITVEHRRFGWRIIAQPSGSSQVAASANPGFRPGAYTLQIAPDLKVLLARGLWSSGRWELRYRRQRIAQIGVSDLRTLTDGPVYQRDGNKVGTLRLERSSVRLSQVELLIALALATIRADASLLDIPGPAGG